jgi:uncharacterized phage-associated protein
MKLPIMGGNPPKLDEVDLALFFLYLAKINDREITHHQLQKLVFLSVVFGLYYNQTRIIETPTMCWCYGPIYPVIYRRFKGYRGNNICSHYTVEQLEAVTYVLRNCTALVDVGIILQAVWGAYKDNTGVELSAKCWKLLYPNPNRLMNFWRRHVRKVWQIEDAYLIKQMDRYNSNRFTILL